MPSALWASFPLLVAFLVPVPLIMIFEDIFLEIILTSTAAAMYALMFAARAYHHFSLAAWQALPHPSIR